MKLKCIDNDGVASCLTVGKEYEVIEESLDCYKVADDQGYKRTYFKRRFEVVKEPMKVRCIENSGVESSLTVGKEYELLGECPAYYKITDDCNGKQGYLRKRFEKIEEPVVKEPVKVRCIDNHLVSASLTVGKEYQVTESIHPGHYKMLDDAGITQAFFKTRFEPIVEEPVVKEPVSHDKLWREHYKSILLALCDKLDKHWWSRIILGPPGQPKDDAQQALDKVLKEREEALARVKQLEEALKPFAEFSKFNDNLDALAASPDDQAVLTKSSGILTATITVGDFRKAAAA